MNPIDVYTYGMTVLSSIHLLKGKYPEANTYQEIQQSNIMPGGEGANCALLLAQWGLRSQLDGCFLGSLTEEPLLRHLGERGVDVSLLRRVDGFDGWRDIVLCDGESRTVFGWFAGLFSGERILWNQPCEASIASAAMVALDPFFREESLAVANLCVKHGKGYVTIDCRHDTRIAQKARAIACSKEFLDQQYPGADPGDLLQLYRRSCEGLVIFTFGSKEILYSSPDGTRGLVTPFQVKVMDSLAAGDTFRAGIVYGLVKGLSDHETVRFAAASAAICCTRFPSILEPPSLDEIGILLRN